MRQEMRRDLVARLAGLVGYNKGTISASYAIGNATGSGNNVGGLVGINDDGTISACYAKGAASSTSGENGWRTRGVE